MARDRWSPAGLASSLAEWQQGGRHPFGACRRRAECQEQVSHHPGATFKKFGSLDDAERFATAGPTPQRRDSTSYAPQSWAPAPARTAAPRHAGAAYNSGYEQPRHADRSHRAAPAAAAYDDDDGWTDGASYSHDIQSHTAAGQRPPVSTTPMSNYFRQPTVATKRSFSDHAVRQGMATAVRAQPDSDPGRQPCTNLPPWAMTGGAGRGGRFRTQASTGRPDRRLHGRVCAEQRRSGRARWDRCLLGPRRSKVENLASATPAPSVA